MPRKNDLFPLEVEMRIAFEVERRPILWDVQSPLYKRADLKAAVWEDIAKILGPAYTGLAVSLRFKNMKDTFMSNLRKVRDFQRKHSGAGTDDKYTPKWPLFTVLKYLEKTSTQGNTTSNIPSTQQAITSTPLEVELAETVQNTFPSTLKEVVVCPQSIGSLSSPSTSTGTPQAQETLSLINNSVYYDETLKMFISIPPDSEEVSVVDSEDPDDPPVPVIPKRPASVPITDTPRGKRSCPIVDQEQKMFQKRGSKKAKGDALMAEAVSVLKDACKQPEAPTVAPPDHEEFFANYVASKMRAMDPEKKQRCEAAILKVLLEF